MTKEEIEEQVTDILEEVNYDISDKLVRLMEFELKDERKKIAAEIFKDIEVFKGHTCLDCGAIFGRIIDGEHNGDHSIIHDKFVLTIKQLEELKKKHMGE